MFNSNDCKSDWETPDLNQYRAAATRSISLSEMESSNVYWTNQKYLAFKVKSENEAFLDFGVEKEMMFRVVIGSLFNRMSIIGTISDPFKTFVKTEKVLDSNNLKQFW